MKYTKEDLMNTWGVVESKEHAEYIVKIAESNGFESSGGFMDGCDKYFYTFEDCLEFTSNGDTARSDGEKQITIPLPPNAKPNFSDLPKRFDCRCNKCGEKCCTGFCGEKPKVGEDVLLKCGTGEMSGKLLALTKEYAIISQGDGEQHLYLSEWRLEKPKSKQELLIDELHQKLLANNCSDEYLLSCDIVQGKVEGLSYE